MTRVNQTPSVASRHVSLEPGWLGRSVGPLCLAAVAVIVLAMVIVFTSQAAWHLLGAGRGLVTPEFYHYTGLLMVLGMTFGQFAGWVIGSALLVYVWGRLTANATTLRVVQVAASIVYCGLAVVPVFSYHFFFGQPLAGLPRPGIAAWISQNYASAYWLLFPGHHVVDVLVIPFLIAVLVLIWGMRERVVSHWGMQTLVLFLIMATSLVVSLSLAIHSILVHIRLGP